MSRINRILIILIFIFSALPTSIINAEILKDKDFEYKEIDGSIEIIEYIGEKGSNIIIPEKIDNKDVISIGANAFTELHSEKVEFPDTLKIIKESAFELNNFKSIEFNDGLKKIESGAFTGSFIEEITLPESIEEIEHDAFKENNIKSVNGYENSYAEEWATNKGYDFKYLKRENNVDHEDEKNIEPELKNDDGEDKNKVGDPSLESDDGDMTKDEEPSPESDDKNKTNDEKLSLERDDENKTNDEKPSLERDDENKTNDEKPSLESDEDSETQKYVKRENNDHSIFQSKVNEDDTEKDTSISLDITKEDLKSTISLDQKDTFKLNNINYEITFGKDLKGDFTIRHEVGDFIHTDCQTIFHPTEESESEFNKSLKIDKNFDATEEVVVNDAINLKILEFDNSKFIKKGNYKSIITTEITASPSLK